MKYNNKVTETSAADADIVELVALPAGAYTYTLPTASNPDAIGTIATASSGLITLATGKSLDYETKTSYVFVVVATPGSGTAGTATVTVEIKNMVEFSQTHYLACIADGTTAGTTIGTFTVADKASDDTITYEYSPTTHFDYDETTGVVTVKTGVTLAMKTLAGYELTLAATASGGSSDTSASTAATLWIAVGICSSNAMQITAMLGIVLLSFATALYL
ncbi:cadherin-5-like [Dreissena polymorpha]|nr:cadherin-5-like [Dreissena polymorpha]